MGQSSPPNGAKESKITLFDSESQTTSNCILRFFRKKLTFPIFLPLYVFYYIEKSFLTLLADNNSFLVNLAFGRIKIAHLRQDFLIRELRDQLSPSLHSPVRETLGLAIYFTWPQATGLEIVEALII